MDSFALPPSAVRVADVPAKHCRLIAQIAGARSHADIPTREVVSADATRAAGSSQTGPPRFAHKCRRPRKPRNLDGRPRTGRPEGIPIATVSLTAADLARLFEAASALLTARSAAIDAINVYPVPDGDTGTNMAATLRESVRQATSEPVTEAGEFLRRLARGALFGARGNSGVILSQALRGLAASTEGKAALDPLDLITALADAARQAYQAVAKPVEGTMLTVLRAASEAAAGDSCEAVLETALAAAQRAEAATPSQLPALAEAGVTDAGGEGICTILQGLHAALTGVELPLAASSPVHAPVLHAHDGDDAFGFCTEFLIEPTSGAAIDLDALKLAIEAHGARSIVVVGDSTLARAHAHTEAPDELIAVAREFGALSRVKVDDMTAQNRRFATTASGASARTTLLALSPGAGFDAIFASLGAQTARLDPLAKPSAGELAAAADALQRPDVILLPNHTNVVMAAEQAVNLASCSLRVVRTETVIQGLAAALAFSPDEDPAALAARMAEATGAVTTIEVTTAAANRSADGIAVQAGEAIALVDGTLRAAAASPLEALAEGLAAAGAEGAVVTVYAGEGAPIEGLEAQLRAVLGETTDLTVMHGGQSLYPYVASVEW
ncbi:MAG: DAK2 domain-containing protein [Dehalococcoidia bacterium]